MPEYNPFSDPLRMDYLEHICDLYCDKSIPLTEEEEKQANASSWGSNDFD